AEAVGDDGHAGGRLRDAAHRRVQHDAPAELRGHLQGDRLRAADEAALLGAAGGVEVALERAGVLLVPRGGDVEERVEEGELARLAAEDRLGGRRRDRHELGVAARVRAQPRVERLPVPVVGAGGSPGLVDGHARRHLVELRDGERDVAGDDGIGRGRAEGRVVRELLTAAWAEEDVVAGVVGRERPDADRRGQRLDVVLRRPGEHAAELGIVADVERLVEHAASDPVAGLEHHHRAAGPHDLAGRRQPRKARADHDHVGGAHRRATGLWQRGDRRAGGRALAIALAEAGADVACAARATDAAPVKLPGTIDETVREIQARGRRGLAIPSDLSRPGEPEAMVARTLEVFGHLDILVNNAAITFDGDLALPIKRWDLVMEVNLRAPLLAMRAALPAMKASGAGKILNISSAAAV